MNPANSTRLKKNKNTLVWVKVFWYLGIMLFLSSAIHLAFWNHLGFTSQINMKTHFITGFKAANFQSIQFFLSVFFYQSFIKADFVVSPIAVGLQLLSLLVATVFIHLRVFGIIETMEPYYTLLSLTSLLLLVAVILVAFILWIFTSIKL